MPKPKATENSYMLPHGPRPTMTARRTIERPMSTAAAQVAAMAKALLVAPGGELELPGSVRPRTPGEPPNATVAVAFPAAAVADARPRRAMATPEWARIVV